MASPFTPQLKLHYGSSALAISQNPPRNLATTLSYKNPPAIYASPKTDLWRKPPSVDIDNAPTLLISEPIDLHNFHSARVTVTGKWNTLYDQGGLCLFIPDEDTKKFLKTGIEFVFDKPYVGTVAASRAGDWSLVPLSGDTVTVHVEREVKDGERTTSLWVYIVDPVTGDKMGIREITWFFQNDIAEKKGGDDQVLLVGIYAARPTEPQEKKDEALEVNFKDFEVTLFE